MNHKKVTSKRATFTKLEREYIKGIVYSLSFQRITDQEIVQWLHEEKQIDIDRSTISKMRNQVERKAEKWYIELRNSTFKYIAIYKERIDSLYSYQKILHGIIATTKKDEVKIRARPYEICTTCNKAKKAVYTDWNVHTLYSNSSICYAHSFDCPNYSFLITRSSYSQHCFGGIILTKFYSKR